MVIFHCYVSSPEGIGIPNSHVFASNSTSGILLQSGSRENFRRWQVPPEVPPETRRIDQIITEVNV